MIDQRQRQEGGNEGACQRRYSLRQDCTIRRGANCLKGEWAMARAIAPVNRTGAVIPAEAVIQLPNALGIFGIRYPLRLLDSGLRRSDDWKGNSCDGPGPKGFTA